MNNRGKDREMAYRCNQAIAGGVKDAIRCKVSGSICAHQYYCEMQGRKVLSAGALDCPARDGKLPEEPKAAPAEKAPEKPAAKPQRKTAGAAKTQRTGKEKKK